MSSGRFPIISPPFNGPTLVVVVDLDILTLGEWRLDSSSNRSNSDTHILHADILASLASYRHGQRRYCRSIFIGLLKLVFCFSFDSSRPWIVVEDQ